MWFVALHIIFAVALFGADPPVHFRVSSETVPPGGTAQIKVFADPPRSRPCGEMVMFLDPAIFGTVTNAAVFSPANDAVAVTTLANGQLDVTCFARSGGIGQLPGLPIFQVSVPVLASVAPVTKLTVTVTLKDVYDEPVATPGTLTVGGSLSVHSVTPGAVIKVAGTGFSPDTAIQLDGAAISPPKYVNSQEIDFTLIHPTELTGKRLVVTNGDGERVEYFCASSGSAVMPAGETVYLTFGTRPITRSAYQVGHSGTAKYYGVLNPNNSPVTLTLDNLNPNPTEDTVAIPPNGVLTGQAPVVLGSVLTLIKAAAPIRALAWSKFLRYITPTEVLTDVEAQTDRFEVSGPLTFDWYAGGTLPPSGAIYVGLQGDSVFNKRFAATAWTTDGNQWLSVAPAQGEICRVCPEQFQRLVVSANPAGLSPGAYKGSVTIYAEDGKLAPATVDVTLNVHLLSISTSNLVFQDSKSLATPANPPLQSFIAGSNAGPVPFTAIASTSGGGNWLAVTPSKATTPATLSASVNTAGLAAGTYQGQITLASGIAKSESVFVTLYKDTPAVVFKAFEGAKSTFWQRLSLQDLFCPQLPACSVMTSASATTTSGFWLKAIAFNGGFLQLQADPTGLGAGTYTGTVTVNPPSMPPSSPDASPLRLPVMFVVSPPPSLASGTLVVEPKSVSLGSNPYADFSVTVGGVPIDCTVASTGDPGLHILGVGGTGTASFFVSAQGSGVYHGSITISAASQSVTVPVTLTNPAIYPPVIGSIGSAASQLPGAVSPGEIVTIHGSEVGPGLSDPSLVRVLFDGIPATVLYVSEWQINAIVPDAIASQPATQIHVEYAGFRSETWGVPVSAFTPAIFTLDGSGVGQAAVLNQDNSVNGPPNAAARGSVVQIFGTGAGLNPTAPVKVNIAGVDAPVLFAGQAPGAVKGLFQVNAVVPSGISANDLTPVVMTVGSARSQSGSTIAVK